MRYDSLHAPVSEAEPCGPDLDETGDDGYANYMLLASGRLPSKFFDINRDTGEEAPFDKARLKELYPTQAAYVRAVTDDVARLMAQRVLTKQDGDDLIAEAKRTAVP